jgi:hypothetical protein
MVGFLNRNGLATARLVAPVDNLLQGLSGLVSTSSLLLLHSGHAAGDWVASWELHSIWFLGDLVCAGLTAVVVVTPADIRREGLFGLESTSLWHFGPHFAGSW